MFGKPVSILLSFLLIIGALVLAFNVQPAKASGTVYIRADGSVDPSTAPINTVNNVTYVLTDNIVYDSVVLERNNILFDGAGHTVTGSISGSGYGMTLMKASNVTVRDVTIKNFTPGGILVESSIITLSGNNITANNGYGIILAGASDITLCNNSVTANNGPGIYLGGASNVTLSNNYVTANYDNEQGAGISLSYSSDITLSGNSVTGNNWAGIQLYQSSNNVLSGNNVTANAFGISLTDSPNNTLSENVMTGNGGNFQIIGFALSDYLDSVDTSNLVDGKPVYYFVNQSDIVVNANAYPDIGYLGLVNCRNMTVQGLNLTKNGQGLLLAFANDSKITGNNVAHNTKDGIDLYFSSGNTLSGNNVTANDWWGIYLYSSFGNTLSGNTIANNNVGIWLYRSSGGNALSGNNVTANRNEGIDLGWDASNNRIFHNNFVNNPTQAATDGSVSNIWDDGYPLGGNYWSDYLTKYPNAAQVDGSGIWNTPYIIDHNNTDRNPLVAFATTQWNPELDSYNQINYASSWSAGNCYGLSSTEILYFMHYVLGDITYPYFPAQSPPANTTSQLNLPQLNDKTWTALNNALLAVMFHQVYDPNHSFNSPSSESAEYNKLVVALASETPALLTMHGVNSTGNDIYHTIVAYGVETLPNGTISIGVSDPNVLQPQDEVAHYDPTTQAFSYDAAGFSFDKFEVVTPEIMRTSWQSLWLYELTQPSWWFDNWLSFSVVGYNIVIADKMVTVDSNGLQDYFTTAGNSSSFICGIPSSSGIEEGNAQVYAIPEGTSFTVSDPTTDQSTILIDRVENESGQLVGYGYLFNVTATQGSLSFNVTPSNSGFLVGSGINAFNFSATIFYATLQNHSIYQTSNVRMDALNTANFTVTNWQMLNNTNPSPVTLIVTPVPEFPTTMIVPFFMTATLLAALILRRKRSAKSIKPVSQS